MWLCVFDSVDHGGEIRIKAGPQKWACFLTLDPNTANTELSLSEESREVTYVREKQSYPDYPDRFDHRHQVLCRESVCGRCYWEIECSGDFVEISVSNKSIRRKGYGDECVFGCNDNSWSLFCSPSSFTFWHNSTQINFLGKQISRRIGVFVDHSAGTLIFYNIYKGDLSDFKCGMVVGARQAGLSISERQQ